jgi:hypothetical protein
MAFALVSISRSSGERNHVIQLRHQDYAQPGRLDFALAEIHREIADFAFPRYQNVPVGLDKFAACEV